MSEAPFPTTPILPHGGLGALLRPGAAGPEGRRAARSAEKAAKDFESVLLHKVLEEMKRTIPESGLLGDGVSRQVRDLFWLYLAQDLADKGGLGVWKQLYRQMGQAGAAGAAPAAEPAP